MNAVIHLSHNVLYNVLLALAVVALFWLLVYLIGAEFAERAPVELIAPA